VLKPGGFAILQVPFFSPVPDKTFEDISITDKRDREKMFGQDDHVRKYGKDYPLRIGKGGLAPFEDTFASELLESVQKKFGLVKEEVIYGGTKN